METPGFGIVVAARDRLHTYECSLLDLVRPDHIGSFGQPLTPSNFFRGGTVQDQFLQPSSLALHVVEAPRVQNFAHGLLHSVNEFRSGYVGRVIQAALLLKGQSYSRRLIPSARGSYQPRLAQKGLDPSFFDPEGHKVALRELELHTPWVHVIETHLDSYEADFKMFLEQIKNGELSLNARNED